ncbi:MAG: glycosyltransferase family 2 protein [Patescibacteria group bacterium]
MTQFRKLSIVIPVFNERKTISAVLAAIRKVELPMEKEIILVDDCSTDGSREILKALSGFKVILLDKNQGKGAAVKRGFGEATGDITLIQDGDLEYDPRDYAALVEPIIEGRADIVYGSRFIESERPRKNRIIYKRGYLFSKALNWMSNILSGARISDMYTCYKVLSRDSMDKIYPRLTSKRFGIDPELTALASKFNLKIEEVPISYRGRTYEEGKKINWKDGLAAIWHIIKFNIFTGK